MRVWLPRSDATPAETDSLQPKVASASADTKGAVLVVDDEQSVLTFLKKALTMRGYAVTTALSGAAGLKIFDSAVEPVSLVLMDSSMPGLSGSQTLEELRKRDTQVPVIMMSGFTSDRLKQQQNLDGLAGFLQKPFLLDELYRKVEEAMRS